VRCWFAPSVFVGVFTSFALMMLSPYRHEGVAAGEEMIAHARPMIFAIDPVAGLPGDQVQITGSDLIGTTSVKYNGVDAPYHVVSGTQIVATVPETCASGVFEIKTLDGLVMTPTFTIYPEIDSITPAIGLPNTVVMISGNCLEGAVEVDFGGTTALFFIESTTSIKAIVPFGATSGDVEVLTPDGRATADNGFIIGTPTPLPAQTGSASAYYPDNPPKVAADSNSWRVTSVRAKRCQPCDPLGEGLAVSAFSKLTKAHKQFVAPSSITQANNAVIVDNHLVVTGFLNGDLNAVTIIDLQSGRTVDDIWCYDPSMSPDYRYIAYVRFYPTHPGNDPSLTSDVYLIYDLKASPKTNRLSPRSDNNGSVYVGIPVYPIENSRRFSYFLGPIHDWSERHALISRFAWRSATELSFVDEHFGERYAVEIGLVDGPYRPTIRATSLGPAKN
jgi:hypothetical protein